MRKFYILSLIFVFGFAFCSTNGFAVEDSSAADENAGFAEDNFISLEDFAFPTAEGAAYIQNTPEFQKIPENIIGTNDIEKMRDLPPESQDYILGTKVGFFAVPTRFDPSRVWICTGFLVGPDLFMTNHHCIHDDFGPLPLEDAVIFMDYYQERNVDRTLGGVTARVAGVVRMDGLKDYALLRLDKPIGNTYGWLQLDTTTHVNSSQSVKLISHSQGRSKEIVRHNSEIVDLPTALTDEYPFLVAYLADSEPGSSGSPVFLREGTGVIAIHHSGWSNRNTGEPLFNAGSLMSHIVLEIYQYLPDNTVSDLVVEVPRVSKDYLPPGEPLTLSATVRNQSAVDTPGTTLRFYESVDNSITTADVEIGTAFVSSLGPFETSTVSVTLTASSLGTYYYKSCVDSVANEAVTDNNCSKGVRVTVSTTPRVYMYWTDATADKIQQANLDGTGVRDTVTGLSYPRGLAVDVLGGKMYWTDATADKIQQANLDGTNIKDLVTGLDAPLNGLALDVTSNKIYWTDRGTGKIQQANLDGTNIKDLVTGLDGPYGLALDVAGNKIYWTDIYTGKIQQANLDGINIKDLVTGLDGPSGLALDVAGNKIYWTDIYTGKIQQANLDGTNIKDLVTGLMDPPGLALDVAGNKMYWTEWDNNKIQWANLDGTNIQDLVTGLNNPFAVALGIPPATGSSPLISFNPSTIANQTFTRNTPTTPLQLPVATGGTPPYTYTLSPIPAGLHFDTATRILIGIPTTVGTTNTTYTATDATGATAALKFTIKVIDEPVAGDPLDVNGDGQVTVIDLAIVALSYGTQLPAGISLPADVNADGVVNLLDLTAVAQAIDAQGFSAVTVLSLQEAQEAFLAAAAAQAEEIEAVAEAPTGFATLPNVLFSRIAYRNVAAALADARLFMTDDVQLGKKLTVLEELLALIAEMVAIPETKALLPNYPNPFNPETWIPYHLATDAEVTLTIYNVRGDVVRQLMLGQQAAGIYESRGRAAYWDGKNQLGEPVASGVYFYTLTAGDFTATRKLLIAK